MMNWKLSVFILVIIVLPCLCADSSWGQRHHVFRLFIHPTVPLSWRWCLRNALRAFLQIWTSYLRMNWFGHCDLRKHIFGLNSLIDKLTMTKFLTNVWSDKMMKWRHFISEGQLHCDLIMLCTNTFVVAACLCWKYESTGGTKCYLLSMRL